MFRYLSSRYLFLCNVFMLIFLTKIVVAQDLWIVCSGHPDDIDENDDNSDWPQGYNPGQYGDTNLNVCSSWYGRRYANGASANDGCRCYAGNGPVQCNRHLADTTLFDWHFQDGATFAELCTDSYCWCADQDIAQDYADAGRRGDADLIVGPGGSVTGVYPLNADVSSDSQSGVENEDPNIMDNATSTNQQTCLSGIDCHTVSDCGNSTCSCRVNSTTYVPGIDVPISISACILAATLTFSTSGEIGGRGLNEDERPCPCNTTYVSHACCDSSNGLVWEAPENYLGILEAGLKL